jgi:hypothetical protein
LGIDEKRYEIKTTCDVGTCCTLSFVEDGVLHQVLRLDYKTQLEDQVLVPDNTTFNIMLEPPMRFLPFSQLNKSADGTAESDFKLHDQPLSEQSTVASVSGNISHEKKVVWQARLLEFDFKGDKYKNITLSAYGRKQDYCFRDPVMSLRKYRAELGHVPEITSRVFVTAFRLFETDRNSTALEFKINEECIKPGNLGNLMGVGGSEIATGTMWQSVFLDRQARLGCLSELPEVDLVARCLEKILELDLVPETFKDVQTKHSKDWAPKPKAIVSNTFLRATVDLKG